MIRPDTLYNLLPQFQRAKDSESGFALLALSRVLESQAQAIHTNIDALLDDWFIETCAQWLVPYIGHLVGIDDIQTAAANIPAQRLRVAEAMRLHGGRGTRATIAQAAAAATGWPAMAVDQGVHLVASQSMRDPRPTRGGSIALKRDPPPPRLGPGQGAHVADMRLPRTRDLAAGGQDDLFAPGTVSLYLWRLRPYAMTQAEPRPLGDGLWALHPLGRPLQLFALPRRLMVSGAAPTLADMPHPLDRAWLRALLAEDRMAAAGLAISVRRRDGWQRLAATDIAVADLSRGRGHETGGELVVLDPETGRLFLPADIEAAAVDYAYGFSTEMGGGPYDRSGRMAAPQDGTPVLHVAKGAAGDGWYGELADALAALPAHHAPGQDVVVMIHDNGLHRPAEGGDGFTVALAGGGQVAIQAANGRRPAVLGDVRVGGAGALMLSGLMVGGTVRLDGAITAWALDCTLMPAAEGRPAVAAEGGGGDIELYHTICGPVRAAGPRWRLAAADCILDGLGGAALAGSGPGQHAARPFLRHVTVFGDLTVAAAPAPGENLLTGRVRSPGRDERQPPGDGTVFLSRRYGDAAYAQLGLDNPAAITAGAQDGGELGAFHRVAQAVRLNNLQAALDGSVPQGMRAGVTFVT